LPTQQPFRRPRSFNVANSATDTLNVSNISTLLHSPDHELQRTNTEFITNAIRELANRVRLLIQIGEPISSTRRDYCAAHFALTSGVWRALVRHSAVAAATERIGETVAAVSHATWRVDGTRGGLRRFMPV